MNFNQLTLNLLQKARLRKRPKQAAVFCNPACSAPENAPLIAFPGKPEVGDLIVDKSGIARSGLLIRHLVMPGNIAGTPEIMSFIAKEISPESYVNIMPQYRPCGEADKIKELARYPSEKEIQEALESAVKAGLGRI